MKDINFPGTYMQLIDMLRSDCVSNSEIKDIVGGFSLIYDDILQELPQIFNYLPTSKMCDKIHEMRHVSSRYLQTRK